MESLTNYGYTKYVEYVLYIPTVFQVLFYPTQALATIAHQYSYPNVERASKLLYENHFGKTNHYTFDCKQMIGILIVAGKRFSEPLFTLFEKSVASGVIEEIAASEEKTVGAWIKDLKTSEETVREWITDHPKVGALIFSMNYDYSTFSNFPIKLIVDTSNLKALLVELEDSDLDLGKEVKPITEWKVEIDKVENQNDIRWRCCQIALSALLTIPLTYISREIVSMLLGRKIEISPFSSIKYKLITGIFNALFWQLAASRIEGLDSSSKIN